MTLFFNMIYETMICRVCGKRSHAPSGIPIECEKGHYAYVYNGEGKKVTERIGAFLFHYYLGDTDAELLMQSQAEIQRNQEESEAIDKNFKEFWMPLISTNGVFDLDKLALELWDYYRFMLSAAEVYCHITGNLISKVNTCASAVISVADDRIEDLIEEAIDDQFQSGEIFDGVHDAGGVASSATKEWMVCFLGDHRTLQYGDRVKMTETPDMANNLLVRTSDSTVHSLQDEHGQYVLLREVKA
jgi:hypothetical protein